MTGDLFAPKPTVENQPAMYGLTLWQPWAWLVSTGAKPVENRPWAPPEKLYGQHIAIHAGMKDDAQSRSMIHAQGVEIPYGLAFGAVIATARVVGLMSGSGHAFKAESPSVDLKAALRWYFGPFGWLLDQVVAIDPVPCRGFQKLWGLPPDVLVRVRANYAIARMPPQCPSPGCMQRLDERGNCVMCDFDDGTSVRPDRQVRP